MKRIISSVLATIIMISSIISLTGCGTEKVHIFTRGEWISEIANMFGLTECYDSTPKYSDVKEGDPYFTAIQACAEWEVIDESKKFKPDDRADVTFGIVTAIKAIGLDKIEKAVNGRKLETDKEILKYFNEHSDVKYISGSNLYMDTAAEIIEEINGIYASLELAQYQDVAFTPSVVSVSEEDILFSADGETASIVNGSYNVGDIISIEPSTNYPAGKYAKVTSISANVIKYVEPTFEEMFDHITMYGTYEPEIIGVVPLTDGVEVESIDGFEVEPQTYSGRNNQDKIYVKKLSYTENVIPVAKTFSLGDIELKLSKTFKSGDASVSLSGAVKVKNIKATVDIDTWGIVVNRADIKVTDTIETSLSTSGKLEKTFNLAKIPCKLWGVVGVDLILAIKVGIEGNISLVWSVDTEASVEYKPLRAPKFHASGSNSNLDVELKAKTYIKPEFKAEFVAGPCAIASVGAYSGVEASAKTKIVGTSDDVSCIDVSAYVPLGIFVGAESKNDTLLGKLGVKKTWTIWTSSTSPVTKKWHIEDGEIVDECTKDKKEEEKIEEENIDNSENSEIDTELIDFICENNGALGISSFYVLLDEGRRDVLKVTQLPDGYSNSNVVFSSSNNEVVTVDNSGVIMAKGQGTCTIKVSTTDGMYEQYCAVRVLASYDVDFTPLNVVTIEVKKYDYTI